jgi:hypothetical protein
LVAGSVVLVAGTVVLVAGMFVLVRVGFGMGVSVTAVGDSIGVD